MALLKLGLGEEQESHGIPTLIRSGGLRAALVAGICVGISLWLQHDLFLGLGDEGWLWYGTWRTALGEVPLRDFQSYDPGRYYWGALWTPLLGHGVVALRISTALFQWIGLSCGLLAVHRIRPGWGWMLAASVPLLLWMFPRFTLFEHSLTMIAVLVGSFLVERPTLRRYFLAGVAAGFAAWMGRNHGLYAVVGYGLIVLFVWIKIDRSEPVKSIGAAAGGVLVGYSPMLLMFAFVPGFFDGFLRAFAWIFRLKTTNITIPMEWPWVVWSQDFAGLGLTGTLARMLSGQPLISLTVLLWIAFCALAAVALLLRRAPLERPHSVLVAGVAFSVPYLHSVMARADSAHLAQAIHPLLLSLLALPFALRGRLRVPVGVVTALVLAASCYFIVRPSYFYQWCVADRGELVRQSVLGDRLWLKRSTGSILAGLERFAAEELEPGEEIFIAPTWPALYVVLGRRSPTYEIGLYLPGLPEAQAEMIARLEASGTRWAVLGDVARDGREDLHLHNTHELLWAYLMKHFEPVPFEGLPPDYALYLRRD